MNGDPQTLKHQHITLLFDQIIIKAVLKIFNDPDMLFIHFSRCNDIVDIFFNADRRIEYNQIALPLYNLLRSRLGRQKRGYPLHPQRHNFAFQILIVQNLRVFDFRDLITHMFLGNFRQ